jgi:hypothetical protein
MRKRGAETERTSHPAGSLPAPRQPRESAQIWMQGKKNGRTADEKKARQHAGKDGR